MTIKRGDKAALLVILAECAKSGDTENAHCDADEALIQFIGDKEIAQAFEKINKWYA